MSRTAFRWARRLPLGFKTAVAVTSTVLVAGCSGGGCGGGCSALGGSQPIPGGFDKAKRVTNSAGVRLTRDGLDFLQANIGAVASKVLGAKGPLTFPIPTSHPSTTILFISVTADICNDGPKPTATPPECIVEINVANMKVTSLQATGPHDLTLAATLPVRLQKLPVHALGADSYASLCKGGTASPCDWVDMPVTADISLEQIDPAAHPSRGNYTKINIKNVAFDKPTLEGSFTLTSAGSIWDSIITGLINLVKGAVLPSLIGGLTSNLTAPLQNATCMKETVLPDGTKQCPDGTFDVAGTCRYGSKDTDECVPMLLGLENRFNLSGLLASISPGTQGGLDFMLASGGDMDPAPNTGPTTNGMTLHMFGGAEPTPISQCVPGTTLTYPTDIVLPDELFGKAPITPWPAAPAAPPHFGLALSERYLNHALGGAYNSGLFCIGISSENISSLNAGLLSILIPSVKHLSDQFLGAGPNPAIAISLRPQQAPAITVGDGTADFGSPLLDLNMKDTDVDFYTWSEDRFIRLFTGRIDLRVPLNISAGPSGIQLQFATKDSKTPGPLEFNNPRISNNNLLLEDEATLKSFLGSIGGLVPTSALSGIKPINLNSALASLGLTLDIPKEGIRKMTSPDGKDRFLAIFGSLAVATGPAMPASTTTARIVKANVDPRNFDIKTVGMFPPSYAMHAESNLDNGAHAVEYAYKVDDSLYTNFSPTRDFDVRSSYFFLQGKHTITIASRLVGVPESQGETTIPVIIDVLPPTVFVRNEQPGIVTIISNDIVSAPRDLKVEARVDGGNWNLVPWLEGAGVKPNERGVAVPMEATQLEVRVTDEAGNVASTSAALIRGQADGLIPKSGGACGCEVPGGSSEGTRSGLMIFGAAAAIGAVVERRRRRSKARAAVENAALASCAVLSIGAAGCNCGGNNNVNVTTDGGSDGASKGSIQSYVKGSYTSAVATSDGKVWVAGYNEGDPVGPDFQADLCVGQWDPASNTVAWKVVDGIGKPDPANDKDPGTWRNGVVDSGDDVGLYTSIVLDSKGNPLVAYFDRTNGALRIAHYDGANWSTHQVEARSKGWAGKFTSMTMVNGVPYVAYQVVEPGSAGSVKSSVRVAHAASDSPAASTDWTIEDVAVEDKYPCIPSVCASDEVCLTAVAASKIPAVCAKKATGCDASCTNQCATSPVDGKTACLAAQTELGIYVNAMGLFNSIASDASGNVGLVFYDRVRGNIRAASNKGGKWTVTPGTAPLDGWTGTAATDVGKGDRGIGATLAIDATGNWHVAYVDGLTESLLYKFVPGGDLTKAAAAIVIDDGLSSDGTASGKFADGVHVVGENAQVTLAGTNIVIVYQDSTAGTLRWAKSTGGVGAKFTRGSITQDGTAGFWPKVAGTNVVNFFRNKGTTVAGDPVIMGDVRGFPLP